MLWGRAEEGPTCILWGHTDSIVRLTIKDDLLFSGAGEKTVRIWDITSGDCVRVLEGHSDYVSILTFSPDHSMLRAGCGGNGELRM